MTLRDQSIAAALGARMLPAIGRGERHSRNAGNDGLAAEPLDDRACRFHGDHISEIPKRKSSPFSDFRHCGFSDFRNDTGSMDLDAIRAAFRQPDKKRIELARRLGVSPSALTEILKGDRKIQLREAPIIADYLGLDTHRPFHRALRPTVCGSAPSFERSRHGTSQRRG